MTGELLAFPSKETISLDAKSIPANGGGGGNVTDITMKDYVDAQSQATRAQNDARFAEVLSELRTLDAKVSHLPSTWTIWAAVFTGVVSILGVMLTMLAFGGDRFDGGAQFTASTYEASQEAKSLSQENARQIKQLGDEMKQLIKALSSSAEPPPP